MQFTALMIAVTFATVGIALVLARHYYRDHPLPRLRKPRFAGVLEHTCQNCHKHLVIPTADLVPLRGSEKALAVRGKPEWLEHKIAEYDCPYCEAAHCFATDVRPIRWLDMNLYSPSKMGRSCRECRKPLKSPPWTRGAYDGRINDAPGNIDDYALLCPHCESPSCVSCCREFTRNRTEDGALLCPRCGRGPMKKFFHESTAL